MKAQNHFQPKRLIPHRSYLIWFIVTFLLTLTLSMLYKVFFGKGTFSLDVVRRLFSSNRAMRSLFNSFTMAFITVITVNLVGVFQIVVTEFFEIKFTPALRLAFLTPLIYSSVSLVTGYKFVYGSRGTLTRILVTLFPAIDPYWFMGFSAVLFVHTFSMTLSYHLVRNACAKLITVQLKQLGHSEQTHSRYLLRLQCQC